MDPIDLTLGFLDNAAARQHAVSMVGPGAPSADYLHGFGDGWEAGQVAGLALAASILTGDSPSLLIENAGVQAAVNMDYPYDLFMEAAET